MRQQTRRRPPIRGSAPTAHSGPTAMAEAGTWPAGEAVSLFWRRAAIRLLLPLSWRLYPQRRGQVLQRFAVTEADSAWHFLDAMSRVDQPGIRARLFNNAVEEQHHSELFATAARGHALVPPRIPIAERTAIYDASRGLQHFFAFVQVGEQDVYEQFDAYAAAIGTESVRSIFRHLKQDEEGHMRFAEQRLAAIVAKRDAGASLVRAIRLQRLIDSLVRGGRRAADFLLTLLFSAVYFPLGLVAAAACRRALASDPARSGTARRP